MLGTHLGAFAQIFSDLTSIWYLGSVCDPYIYEWCTPASKSYPHVPVEPDGRGEDGRGEGRALLRELVVVTRRA